MSGVESDEMEIRRLHIYAVLSQTLLDNECCLWIITSQLLEVIRSSLLAELYVLLVLLMGRCLLSDTDLQQYSPHYLTSIQGSSFPSELLDHLIFVFLILSGTSSTLIAMTMPISVIPFFIE